jgi:hypothetical protein
MTKIHMVITNGGDGSNSIEWVLDEDVLDKMEERADDGDEGYASGDGLQTRKLVFPDDFDLNAWMKTNHITVVTMKDMGG